MDWGASRSQEKQEPARPRQGEWPPRAGPAQSRAGDPPWHLESCPQWALSTSFLQSLKISLLIFLATPSLRPPGLVLGHSVPWGGPLRDPHALAPGSSIRPSEGVYRAWALRRREWGTGHWGVRHRGLHGVHGNLPKLTRTPDDPGAGAYPPGENGSDRRDEWGTRLPRQGAERLACRLVCGSHAETTHPCQRPAP